MTDSGRFAVLLLLIALAALAAIASHGLSARLRLPAPALFFGVSVVAVWAIPSLQAPPQRMVERIVSVALLAILFNGGLDIGRAKFRASLAPIVTLGVLGTFLTTFAIAGLAHAVFGLGWYASVLLGIAIAPTDPVVVFSVLGQREVGGRSATILEGESGANDPVGISLLVSLLAAGSLTGSALAGAAGDFVLQLGVGAAVGVLAGLGLSWLVHRVTLPSDALYPLSTLACVFGVYGATTLLHGSGFLAVFLAGVMLGDEQAPFMRQVEQFHSVLASLGEIVAFVVLGLTVSLTDLGRLDVMVPGLVLGIVLAVAVRPLLLGPCLMPVHLLRSERVFILFSGLKGAVPILLGSMLLGAEVTDSARVYGIVVVVVVFSVLVQGGLVPVLVKALHLPTPVSESSP